MSASVCMLQSRDCATLKSAVETMVYNFIESIGRRPTTTEVEDEDTEHREKKRLRRTQCNMRQLLHWYRCKYIKPQLQAGREVDDTDEDTSEECGSPIKHISKRPHALVVILPDFECFNTTILQDFILILSAYHTHLPFVLVFGVATAVSAVHNALPYHVTSKVKLCVFKTQTAPVCLNEVDIL